MTTTCLSEGYLTEDQGKLVRSFPLRGGIARLHVDHAARCAEAARYRAEEIAMTMTLYELNAEFQAIHRVIAEADGEVTAELEAKLDELGELEGRKLDNYNFMLKELDGLAQLAFAQRDALDRKGKRLEATVERLKERVLHHMKAREVTEIQGQLYTAKCQTASTRKLEVLVDPAALPVELQKPPAKPTANNAALKELADADGNVLVDGVLVARLLPATEFVRFY